MNSEGRALVMQAVAIGAAMQAGLYDGIVSGVMVMDIWQATLMRAFATQQLGMDDVEGASQAILI